MSKNVIVLGMARSGTSLTAAIFARRGYYVGAIDKSSTREGDIYNPFGYFEADDLVERNVDVLRRAGYNFHNTWLFEPISRDSVVQIAELIPTEEDRRFVEAYERNPRWIWKDPRLCFTIPYWWKLMDPEKTRVLMVHRDPEAIYWSFRCRGWCGSGRDARERILRRVEQHVFAAREATDSMGIPHIEVDYDDYLERPAITARRIGELFDLELSPDDFNVHRDLNHGSRATLSKFVRVWLMRIPGGTRSWLRSHAPRSLIRAVFSERKYLRKDEREV